MRKMSPSLLLRKRMSSETLEGEDQWTQEVVQQKSKIRISKLYKNMHTCTKKIQKLK